MAVELSAYPDTISFAPPPPHFFSDLRLVKGWNNEQRVAAVISTLPQVETVRVTDRYGDDDAKMIDLRVKLDPENTIPSLEELLVQVKSSGVGVREFKKKKIADWLKDHDLPSDAESRKRWMMQNGMMVINGGTRNEKNKVLRLTDEEIAQSFLAQFKSIVEFHQTNS